MPILATPDQLQRIHDLIFNYLRLPLGLSTVPGSLMEANLKEVRGGDTEVLHTYDFVDVISRSEKIGWQVKSTNSATPVTWIRGKIANKEELIKNSHASAAGLQELGDTVIDYCNHHIADSFTLYGLEEIGYSRLINFGGKFRYFEIPLIKNDGSVLFKPANYEWKWSKQKNTVAKEQKPALHGFHKQTQVKHWAWHGLGENQLHFTGERLWWPDATYACSISFAGPLASQYVSFEALADWLATL
jgi:hypothetical protein